MKKPGSRWMACALVVAMGLGVVGTGCGSGNKRTTTSKRLTPANQARMADSYLRAGRVDDALAALDDAIAQEPDNPQWSFHRGRVCFEAGRYEESEQAFLRALELNPNLTDVHNFLGAVYNELGRKDEAEKRFRIVLEDPAYPTPEKAYFNLGRLYASQGRDEEGIDNLRRAVEINPKYYAAHFQLASLLDRTNRLDEAASEYEVAAPGFRASGDYHYRLGFVYFRLGRKDQARDSLRRAIDVAPGSRSAAKAGDLLRTLH